MKEAQTPKKSTRVSKTETPEAIFEAAHVELIEVDDAVIAVRKFGAGKHPVIFIHGYPVNGYTWRKLVPELSKNFTCIVIDLPGLGDSKWSDRTDFTFTAQASRVSSMIDKLGLKEFSMVAQDTGATIARMVALEKPEQAKKLVLFNTEIPGHRPPFIPTYQKLAKLPGAALLCKYALQSKPFLISKFGFGQFYTNKALFDDPEFLEPYTRRFKNSLENIQGALNYQDGIEWNVIDDLEHKHAQIKAGVLLLWGENDGTFPVDLAQNMSKQFQNSTFIRLKEASLMPQEEVPSQALEYMVPFLNEAK